ncbi:MAG TPA: class I SAM-dependent rRNA methyltransferase [Candidatus Angelobacter sp.]|nr:class I SAM-dependent rRNA methyltransferase [Candidatus Angelobacter sp.]
MSARAASRLRHGHVWVYRSEIIAGNSTPLPPGIMVHVEDERGKFLGSMLYSSSSQIALRKLTGERLASQQELLDLLQQRVRDALGYRARLLREEESNAVRLIFSEADGLPGLIVDRYNDIVSLYSQTQALDRPEIKQAVVKELQVQLATSGVAHIVERVEPHIRELEQLPPAENHLLWGEKTSTQYVLNGVRFHYDALSGQKTGAFLDQRENYAAAEKYAHGKALDVFCYQGGFALHLARACAEVTALDSSRPALEVAEENEKLNHGQSRPPIEWIEANAFDFLKDYSVAGKQYDTVVLDPPAFAKSKRNLETALRGYKELNLRAVKMLRPGGVLVTCSCSYHVNEQDFLQMLTAAAVDAGRALRLLEIRTQSKDHPIVLGIPETHYLKCLICTVA